jgi:aminocarboxymuconate-semialdehyde decarboxylase
VDIHAHILTRQVEALTAGRPERAGEAGLRVKTMGQASVDFNAEVMMPVSMPRLTDLDRRLADMDAMGVDIQVISPSPNQYHYWAPADLAEEIVRLQNENIAGACASRPDRLAGLGMAAMQHPALAVQQIRHAVKTLGLKGIEISTLIDGAELSDRKFDPVWAELESLGAVVFIHPMGCSLGERLAPSYLSNSVGQPVETAVALSHLIFGGVLDRQPGLKVVAAHGGGYLPTYIGRADHAWTWRPDARTCACKPSSYLKRLYFDSLVYSPQALAMLVQAVGAGRVVLGADYPFDMGAYDMHAVLAQTPGLTEDDRRAILGETLAALLNLTPPPT